MARDRRQRKPPPRRARCAVLWGLWLLAFPLLLPAAPNEVLIVVSKREGAYQRLSKQLTTQLHNQFTATRLGLREVTSQEWQDNLRQAPPRNALIITVGTEAAEAVRASALDQPVLHTLIPQRAHQKLGDGGRGQTSALYLDQPLRRQLDLIRLALPQAKTLAVVWGPSQTQQQELTAIAKERGYRLISESVNAEAQLLPALHRLLDEAEVLLALPDPLVYNANTIHHVLLTTYRYRVPVIGFAPAYVQAGAVAEVSSSPEQLTEQILEMITPLLSGRAQRLPAAQWPRYFSVTVNERVATALGLSVPGAQTLERELARREAR